MARDIEPTENAIAEDWSNPDSPNFRRISGLIRGGRLRHLATNPQTWEKLYIHVGDRRYWVLSYPHSEMHGGGPPLIEMISDSDAEKRFGEFDTENPGETRENQ